MRTISVRLLMFVLWCGCASAPPPAASSPSAGGAMPPVSKSYALTGNDGVVVEVVDFQNGEALLRVTGVDSPLKDKVLSQHRGREGQDLRYTMQWGGRDRLMLLQSGSEGWIGKYWQLYVPGLEAIPVTYSDAHSSKVDAEKLFAAHEKQRQSGELEELQRFHQSAERGVEDEAVANAAAAASSECGASLTAAIVWETVSDQALREHSVADWCACALRAIRSACFASPEAKTFVQNQVRSVSCRLNAGAGEMSVDAGRLTWSASFALSDLDNLAGKAFSRLYLPQ